MKTTISTTLVVLAILVLATGIFFAGWMFSHINFFGPGWMMGGYDQNSNGYGPGGMMGGAHGYGFGGGMMGRYAYSNADPVTIDQMRSASEAYIRNSAIAGLEVGEIMIFDNNAYAIVLETETGLGAFELLMNSGTTVAFPEYGPNMMWNLKFGGMAHAGMMSARGGGMMGGWNTGDRGPADISADMPVTREEALSLAQAYLDQVIPGAILSEHATQFYGYYTMDFEQDGEEAGMLSVNGFNQQVFLHTWHGTFIEESGME